MTKQIPLTKGQVALIDDEDFDYINQWKWNAYWSKSNNSYYARRTEMKPFQKTIMMARVIAKTPNGMIPDHVNHNTLDNRKQNLRNASHSQNQMNKRCHRNNSLGEKCICFHRGKFRVQIRKDRKMCFEKSFAILNEAISIRDKKLSEIHGRFSYK